MAHMTVADVMTRRVVTVAPGTPYKDILRLLVDHAVSAVPVVEEGRLVGVVSEADLVARAARDAPRPSAAGLLASSPPEGGWAEASGLTAADLASVPPVVARPRDDVRVAARRMREAGVRRLPVVDGRGRLVGIVSRHDVLRLFDRDDRSLLRAVRATLAHPDLGGEDHDARAAVEDGVVTLSGTVARPAEAWALEGLAWRVPGVIGVVNRLTVRSHPGRAGPGA